MRRIVVLALLTTVTRCFASDGVCFRSVGEAAAGAGMRDTAGFRVVGIRHDAFSTTRWVLVGNCLHPERPAAVVQAPEGADTMLYPAETAILGAPITGFERRQSEAQLVRAGDKVLVVRTEESLRVELSGVALAGAHAGERIQVRLSAAVEGGAEKFVTATVRADGVLEMEAR